MARIHVYRYLFVFVFGLLPQALASPPGGDALSGTVWVLESLGSRPLRGDAPITLGLSDGAFGGHSGCNRYGGVYQASATGFAIAHYRMTMLGCALPAQRQEAAYAVALSQAARYRLSGDRLELVRADGGARLVFRKGTELAENVGLRTTENSW